jgi:hypothetical protein
MSKQPTTAKRLSKQGRKPIGDKPLSKPYSFRLSDDEAKKLDEKIAASGLKSTSEFIRNFVLKNRVTVIVNANTKRIASLEKRRMQFVFNKAGNNLNQIAHVLNTANMTYRLTDSLFRQAVRGLDDIARYLKAALDHVD